MPAPDQPEGQPGPAPEGGAPAPAPQPPAGDAPVQAPPPPPQAADRRLSCPECGEMAEPGQELCLRCGARVGRTYRRPPSWRVPAALAALGILLIGAGVGFAVADLTHNKDSKNKKTVVPLTPTTTASAPAPTTTTTATTAPPTTTNTTPTSPGAARGVVPVPSPGATTNTNPTGGTSPGKAPASWPAGKTGYTVVLATARTRPAAEASARRATAQGVAAGVLRAADYRSVPGPWAAFSGQYKTLSVAQAAAKSCHTEGFKLCRATRVQPRPGH